MVVDKVSVNHQGIDVHQCNVNVMRHKLYLPEWVQTRCPGPLWGTLGPIQECHLSSSPCSHRPLGEEDHLCDECTTESPERKTHTHTYSPGNTFQWSYPVISTAFQTGPQGFKLHTKTVAICLVSMCLVSPAYFVNFIRNVFMSIIINLHGFQFSYWVMSKSFLFEITAALQHKHELVEEAKRNRPSQSSAPTNVIIWFTGKNYLTRAKRNK